MYAWKTNPLSTGFSEWAPTSYKDKEILVLMNSLNKFLHNIFLKVNKPVLTW